jgi:hypothetical protein
MLKVLKLYFLSNRLIKNQMRVRRRTNMKKPTCNKAIEHMNAL